MSRAQVFRHMMPRDVPVFATYALSPEGQEYQVWEFDVIVGDPEDPGPFYPPNVRRQALYLNALKIDAIGWFFASPTLIECKPHAGVSAIGQIISYCDYYQMTFGVRPRGMIVCESMSRQVETICTQHEILVRRVLPADDYTIERAIYDVRPKIQVKSILPQFQAVS